MDYSVVTESILLDISNILQYKDFSFINSAIIFIAELIELDNIKITRYKNKVIIDIVDCIDNIDKFRKLLLDYPLFY
jgi:hypothetical protein